jgi:thioredoxin 1
MNYTTIEKTPVVSTPVELEPLPETILTQMSKEDFANCLKNNKGAFVIKFGAEWCGPCKKIEPLVHAWMSALPPTIQGAIIDIDDNFELYAFLKSKKQVNGVPVLMCYAKGNLTPIPNEVVVGADENQLKLFFAKCLTYV